MTGPLGQEDTVHDHEHQAGHPRAYHDPASDVTLVGAATPQGVHLGVRAAQPWYAAGVHIPTGHPAEGAARAMIGALAPSPVAARPEGTLRAALEALAAEWEGGADLDPALDDLGDLAQAGARRGCARQLRALLRGAHGGTP